MSRFTAPRMLQGVPAASHVSHGDQLLNHVTHHVGGGLAVERHQQLAQVLAVGRTGHQAPEPDLGTGGSRDRGQPRHQLAGMPAGPSSWRSR